MTKDDNIIQLPTTANIKGQQRIHMPGMPSKPPKQEGGHPVLQRISQNRRKGLEDLEHKVDVFDNPRSHEYEAHINDRFRDLEVAIKATFMNLEALNSLVDMILHDLTNTIRTVQAVESSHIQYSGHLQIIKDHLSEDGLLDEKRLEKLWNEKIVPRLKALKDQR